MSDKIDIEKLREDLIDYFGSACNIFQMAIINVAEIEKANEEKLRQIATDNKINLDNYIRKM